MRASSRLTALVLTDGSVVSAAFFLVAVVLELVGRPQVPGTLDVSGVTGSIGRLEPWGWATIGVLAAIITPVAGLIATAAEYRGRREAILAAGVIGILGISLLVALLQQ